MQVCSDEYEEVEQQYKDIVVDDNIVDDNIADDIVDDNIVDEKIEKLEKNELLSCFFDKWKKNTIEFLNENDDDEKLENRLYILSIDGIPYFYEENLVNVRNKMWNVANTMLKTANDSNLQILSSNINEIKIISPYQFFMLNYNHVLFHFTIDYVIPSEH